MSISRRSFFSAVAGAIAGAVASKTLAAPSETPKVAAPPRPMGIVEFCRQYLPQHKIEPWQEDALVRIEAAKLSANVQVPACLIEDSMVDWSGHVYRKFAREMAEQIDRDCWGTLTATTPLGGKSFEVMMDFRQKYIDDGFITINEARAMEGLRPLSASQVAKIMDVPVEMLKHGQHNAADSLAVADRKKWLSAARRRFDFTLDPYSPPR